MLGLALSGGGFRATLFHAGSLMRINEAGLLAELDEVTSVSGGSIIAGYLATRWHKLDFNQAQVATNFDELVVAPIQDFCGRTIDVGIILRGLISPFHRPSDLLISKYRKGLFGDATLQAFPATGQGPRFTIYSTSLQTGASVRFTRDYLGEYHLGKVANPTIDVALAVAASSAFPPPLCPVKLSLEANQWTASKISDLHNDEYLSKTMWLADGGIYDNMGLERLSKTCDRILVSDAGAPFGVTRRSWATRLSQLARTKRTLDIMSEQVRALRSRTLIAQFRTREKTGAYWGINTRVNDYPLADQQLAPALLTDDGSTRQLAQMRTRLNRFTPAEQEQLINWGYVVTDAALRSRFDPNLEPPIALPFSSNGSAHTS